MTRTYTKKRADDAKTHVVKIPLLADPNQTKDLELLFYTSTKIYNACLGELLKRRENMLNDPDFARACQMPKQVPNNTGKKQIKNKERQELFKQLNLKHGFNKYSIITYASSLRKTWVADHSESVSTQDMAKRAWNAVSEWHFGKRGKPRFKSWNRGIKTLTGTTTKSPIRLTDNSLYIGGSKRSTYLPFLHPVEIEAPILYSAITKVERKGKIYYEARVIVDGAPPARRKKATDGIACLDLGPSHMSVAHTVGDDAWSGTQRSVLSGLENHEREIARLQRQLDRQHRAGSPQCFKDNGVHKRGRCKWKKSARARAVTARIKDLHQRMAAFRESAHGDTANSALELAHEVRLEKVSYKGWQKLYGRSTGRNAVGSLASMIESKAESAGSFLSIDTYSTTLSQLCLCGNRKKKQLSERVHKCSSCNFIADRDVLSAFLGLFVVPSEDGKQKVDLAHARRVWDNRVECSCCLCSPRLEQADSRGVSKTKWRGRSSRRSVQRIRVRRARKRGGALLETEPLDLKASIQLKPTAA